MRSSSTCAGATAVVLALALSATTGCGRGEPSVNKSALYTPESLADELAYRYRALKPEARKFTRAAPSGANAAKRAAALERGRQAEKQKGGGADVPKKRTGPASLDDVMDDIDTKLDKVQGTPRPETCRRMIEALSKDAALSAEDRTLLSERLKQMGGS